MLYARLVQDENKIRRQTLKEHCQNVAQIMAQKCKAMGLENAGYFVGILHDMGKASGAWQKYLEKSARGEEVSMVPHAKIGAQYLYAKSIDNSNMGEVVDRQCFALTILAHHTGLPDCLDFRNSQEQKNKFSQLIENTDENLQDAMTNFLSQVADESELSSLYEKAKVEIAAILEKEQEKLCQAFGLEEPFPKIFSGEAGILARFFYSALVYADWQDAANFEIGSGMSAPTVDWSKMRDAFEAYLDCLTKNALPTQINKWRSKLSLECKNFAQKPSGVYQLYMPTGMGKTLASLRYALNKEGCKKIIYVIPYLSVIEQNAAVIKKALGKYGDMVLEYHSNVIFDKKRQAPEDSQVMKQEKLLSEQWDYPIIMTTMVQFLNVFFADKASAARRFTAMQDAVIIFDEIQSLPIKCVHLFNLLIRFLHDFCHVTAILCSATQPTLQKRLIPLPLSRPSQVVTKHADLLKLVNRTKFHNKLTMGSGHSLDEICTLIIDCQKKYQNLLMICNTKKSALDIYQKVKEQSGLEAVFYLSTQMCARQRRLILYLIKRRLRSKKPVICISTQLIEAGVDISFRCVIRSLAGLDSIAQSAGRCNRGSEYEVGDVYIVDLQKENLTHLPEIEAAKKVTRDILPADSDNYLEPQLIERYYERYFEELNKNVAKNDVKRYPTSCLDYVFNLGKAEQGSIIDLLTDNLAMVEQNKDYEQPFPQAFKTAYSKFSVIDADTVGIIVPCGKKAKLLLGKLADKYLPWQEKKLLLRQAQQFTVNVYRYKWQSLCDEKLIYSIDEEHSIWQLDQYAFDSKIGIKDKDSMQIDDFIF